MTSAAAQAARKKKRRRKKKKKHPAQAVPPAAAPAAGAPASPPSPPTYRWIVDWDDSKGDGWVRPVDDGQNHDAPQDPATIPPRPLPQPQNPAAPQSPQPMGVYSGPFGRVEANRLLWRAGTGPRPGQAAAFAEMGMQAAVLALTRPGSETFSGPAPTADGYPLAPTDAYGHDQLWWLDRLVRTNQPLIERIALVFHDWFATSNDKVDQPQLMINQTNLFRNGGFGSFRTLLENVTADPAMIVWLDSADNRKNSPNENYAREVMELFTLGADRHVDKPADAYSEDDVRELALALTGFDYDWSNALGAHNFHFDNLRHDTTTKSVFSQAPFNVAPGNWSWQDACRLVVEHPYHASFFVKKLWSYFIPVPPSASTQSALEGLYTSNNYAIRPVLEAILMHPDFYEGPAMVKPPAIYLAGLMRSTQTYVHEDHWTWLSGMMGQQLFYPPNVSGWDDKRWLDTNTMRGRWVTVNGVLDDHFFDPWHEPDYDNIDETPQEAMNRALDCWDFPPLRSEQQNEILNFAQNAWPSVPPLADWQQSPYRALRQNGLRQLIAVCPDLQVS
jgi:hypothetical protein